MESLHVADRSFQTAAARLYRRQVRLGMLRYVAAVRVVYHATARATPGVVEALLRGILFCRYDSMQIRAIILAACERFSADGLSSTNSNKSDLISSTSDQHGPRAFDTSSKLQYDSPTRLEVIGVACNRFMDLRCLYLLHNIRDDTIDQRHSIPYQTSSSGHKFSG